MRVIITRSFVFRQTCLQMEVLLTWNCLHLANPNKMEHIRLVNYELGLSLPVLTTPLNYLSEGESDG